MPTSFKKFKLRKYADIVGSHYQMLINVSKKVEMRNVMTGKM